MTDTEVGELLVLVVKMRRWQRTFFQQGRTQHALLRAKDYERQVDHRLRAWLEAVALTEEDACP
jgi:hypothetical protein